MSQQLEAPNERMQRRAPTDYDVHELVGNRWSPRAFSSTVVGDRDLRSLLEAARWAPSCNNEQPWRFIVARRQDAAEFDRLLSCLNEKNRVWAKDAGVLILSAAGRTFSHNGAPNRHALHDVGLATAQLTLQATALGLGVHAMAGFSIQQAKDLYSIPDDFEPVAVIAVGHPGDPDALLLDLRERELAPRSRRPQDGFVFAGTWGIPLQS